MRHIIWTSRDMASVKTLTAETLELARREVATQQRAENRSRFIKWPIGSKQVNPVLTWRRIERIVRD